MRAITPAVLLLASLTAQAETITLSADACTSTHICWNVPNDANATIAYVDWASQYRRLLVSVNGITYDSGLYAVSGLSNVPLYAPDGSVLYATINFSEVRKPCVRSGRVTVCPVIVTLTGGMLVTP